MIIRTRESVTAFAGGVIEGWLAAQSPAERRMWRASVAVDDATPGWVLKISGAYGAAGVRSHIHVPGDERAAKFIKKAVLAFFDRGKR